MVNATFYGGQKPATFARWRDETPIHFRFAIKGHRIVTHLKRLKGVAEAVSIQRASVAPLAGRLAAVLWQLPANLDQDLARLDGFLGVLDGWSDARHVIEFRGSSWFDEAVQARLADHRVAIAQSDAPKWPLWDRVSGDLVYIRLHGHTRLYASSYAGPHLDRWADKIRRWRADGRAVQVYFDNTGEGAAPKDALALKERLALT
jgi:uncharacterized protein YecE (DUF72 family)